MHISILTLFPDMFQSPLAESIIHRALARDLLTVEMINLRDFTHDSHRTVDDAPYGGGPGMLMKPAPVFEAVEATLARIPMASRGRVPIILLSPQGRLLNQQIVDSLAAEKTLVLICGRYEGVDERVVEHLATDEISIGDYVLSGGELAAMVLLDAVARGIPGVLGSEASLESESHVQGLLEYPQYTRPAVFRGWPVPPVLLSGNHQEVARWRREQSLFRTLQRRPDLLERATLAPEDLRFLGQAGARLPRPRDP